jgi:hypothetical protein
MRRRPIKDFLKELKSELPKDLLDSLDLTQPVSTIPAKDLSLGELKEIYKDKGVPIHRFGFSALQKILVNPIAASAMSKTDLADLLKGLDTDISGVIDSHLKTEGDTRYEEIKCIGFNPDLSSLTAIINVKHPYGYCGDLCKKGSYEHVAFWEWDETAAVWI